jgi:endonuclease/exonuclease/phosphatase family metal-dependent hydrolase
MVVAATLLSYLTSFYPPQKLWIFSTLGLVYPLLFFGNCFFIIVWLFQDVKWLMPSLLCVLIGWNYTTGFIGVNGGSGDVRKSDIKILSYNTHFFAGMSFEGSSNSIYDAFDFMKKSNEPDIVCLQEFNTRFKRPLIQKFEGYKYISAEGKRSVILSKYPVIAQGEIDFGTKTNSCVWADLLIGQDTCRVYSIHLQSSNITKVTDNMLDNIDLQEKSTWQEARTIISRYQSTSIKRAEQAALIKDHASQVGYRIIIAGDMNEPPSSYTYNVLCKDMQDSFREKATGIKSTYGGRIPFLRIDYILADTRYEVIDYKTYDVEYSDHFPITSILRNKS